MKIKYCIIAFIFFLAACQKGIEPFDSGSEPTGTDITGTWNFISLKAHTQTTLEYIQADSIYKTISYSNYTSADNTGTVTFDSAAFNSAGIGYNVNDSINSYNYENDILVDSSHMPFSITVTNTSSSGNYKLVGNDSIYFPAGSFISVDGTAASQPSGGRLNITGNVLTITEVINKDTSQNAGNIPYHKTEAGTFIIQLQKK